MCNYYCRSVLDCICYMSCLSIWTGHLTARSDVYGFGVVLLEMLIGRRALDKSRPSREHNLVEWARPLLNHNKKLLKILDPKMDGQYSSKTAIKVAHLAYQCLSQNPKGRPLMSQVVEILEIFQSSGENEVEQMLQSGSSSITIYEVPKVGNDTSTEGKNQSKSDEIYRSEAWTEKCRRLPSNDHDLSSSSSDIVLQDKSASRSWSFTRMDGNWNLYKMLTSGSGWYFQMFVCFE